MALIAFHGCKEVKKDAQKAGDAIEVGAESVIEEVKEIAKIDPVNFMLTPKSGSTAKGEVSFSEENGKVKMVANLEGLTPGAHAIHIHQKADCSADDGTSTGGHWNPTNEPHGKWGASEGYHKGDIGNLTADDQGNASLTFETEEWCIGCDDDQKNIIGKAVIVHQGTDDYVTQPTGAAGARVSCTGIIQ